MLPLCLMFSRNVDADYAKEFGVDDKEICRGIQNTAECADAIQKSRMSKFKKFVTVTFILKLRVFIVSFAIYKT